LVQNFDKIILFLKYFLTISIVATLNFAIPRVMPGDPILNLFGEEAYLYEGILMELKREFGLDKPLHEQYLLYLLNLFSCNLGFSFSFQRPVSEVVAEYMLRTLILTIPSTILGIILGIYLALLIVWKGGERAMVIMILIYSIPAYWLGMVFLYIFSFKFGLFPLGGAVNSVIYINRLILPFLTIVIHIIVLNAIMGRAILAGTLRDSFVLTAISKGLKNSLILRRHVLKPSLAPIIALASIEFGFAFSGSTLVEIVFSYPGIGMLTWEAIKTRDYPILQAIFFIIALVVIIANAIADLISRAIDPRLRS